MAALLVAGCNLACVMLVYKVSSWSSKSWIPAWSVSTATFCCSSRASYFSSTTKVTTSAICSRSSLVSVTLVLHSSRMVRFFLRDPLTGSLVCFVPRGESVPPTSNSHVPIFGCESICISSSTSFSVGFLCCGSFVLLCPCPSLYTYRVVNPSLIQLQFPSSCSCLVLRYPW